MGDESHGGWDRVKPRRRWLARIVQRHPWIAVWIQRSYRVFQPRFTIGAVGVLLDESGERVLLVEHLLHARTPWGLPGGWIGRGEDPAQAVEREFREETGLKVRAVRPLVVARGPLLRGHLDMVYACVLDGAGQEIRLCRELLDYRWTPCDALPPMVAFHRQGIAAALELATHVNADLKARSS